MKDNFVNIVLKNSLKIIFSAGILAIFFYILMPFMVSIVLGGILAMALTPFVDFFMRRGLSRGTSLIVFSSLLLVGGLIPVIGFFIRGSRLVTEFLHESNFSELSLKFTSSVTKLIDHASSFYGLDKTLVNAKVSGLASYLGTALSTNLSQMAYELPEVVMGGLVTILSLYCFLRESSTIRSLFDRYFYFSQRNGDEFVRILKVCCREVFFSNIITGLLQATVVSVGAVACGIGDFFLIFFITFIVSFIPIIGAAPVAAVLGVLCFMDSRMGAGIGMMAVAFVSGLSDNLIRPFLGSLGAVEVHPFIGLLSVIGGVIMFGLPGLFLGPLVASLVFGALPIIIDEFFPPAPLTQETVVFTEEVSEMIVVGVKGQENADSISH